MTEPDWMLRCEKERAALEVQIDRLHADAAILYQVLGVLLWDTERFDTDEGQAILDLASHMAGNRERKDSADYILPFDSTWPEKLHDD